MMTLEVKYFLTHLFNVSKKFILQIGWDYLID